ncbi:glycosyltransferase [[Phormidium] sp. ETS-05]|uniref:glycosyltransferase n=1 Tax=[Phormidium] sp. ETS-05 TaxID=222819 RepID=UPI0018EEE67C|nr:glycosyltransferase [[Phormidium] sp. ETS-05]
MTKGKLRLIVQGWRHIPHSYAIINQFLLLEMLRHPQLEVWHQDAPYLSPDWQPVPGLLGPEAAAVLDSLETGFLNVPPSPSPVSPDALWRVYCPFNLSSFSPPDHRGLGDAKRTGVFVCVEWGILEKAVLRGMGVSFLTAAQANSDAIIITPSHWSKEGLLRSGADPSKLAVVPLGVDTSIYHPADAAQRELWRQQLGLEGCFVFLNVGLMCGSSQGIGLLLKAFAIVAQKYPHVRLLLKGRDALFPSREALVNISRRVLTDREAAFISERITYIGDNLSSPELARLYQAADAYISPYLAEGFNLPVLEAAACGLPVICTQGGPTDDFTHPDFTLYIPSQRKTIILPEEDQGLAVIPDKDSLIALMEAALDTKITTKARQTGPAWVQQRFTWKHTLSQLLNILAPDMSLSPPSQTQISQPVTTRSLVVEGWRFLPHSYAIANQYQLLELRQRPQIQLFHRDVPYLKSSWQPNINLFDADTAAKLNQIPPPPPNHFADVILRMAIPYNFKPGNAQRTAVFCTTEAGIVTKSMLAGIGVASFPEALNNETIIITPSHWSKSGFLRSGAPADRVFVVPLGVDTDIYKPLPPSDRQTLRQQMGIENCFVFLNIGILSDNKGIRPLLKAFAAIAEHYPQARLVFKGAEPLFESTQFLTDAAQSVLNDAEIALVEPRLAYIGKSLSAAEIIRLYQAADAYVSPYLAEGFNMPVLEAAACGLPVICTQGGSTDDFTHPDFALPIDSRLNQLKFGEDNLWLLYPDLDSLIHQMNVIIESDSYRQQARRNGPEFVRQHFTWKQVVDKLLDVL